MIKYGKNSGQDQELSGWARSNPAHQRPGFRPGNPPKPGGFGSRASGGELLFLALATRYCNDIYREAARRGIPVERVEVEVSGDFEREGGPASNVSYRARVKADASRTAILELMRHTDTVAEIQNTLRTLTPVVLGECEVIEGE